MQNQPRQIKLGLDYGGGKYLAWEDTGEPLNYDELYDVVEAYNLLLRQQFAAQVDFGE